MLYGPRTSRLRARASSTFPNSQYGLLLPLVPIGIYSPLINYYCYLLVPKEKPATHLRSNRPRVVAGCTTGSHRPLGVPTNTSGRVLSLSTELCLCLADR